MIKIFDGVRYDTAKATVIGSAEAPGRREDLHWWAETLYKTPRSGKFFIHGTWAGISGDREGIKPVGPEAARKWCEQYMEGTDWKNHFED